jgi:pimeloyl-ACP methyl ester carboxylesterase
MLTTSTGRRTAASFVLTLALALGALAGCGGSEAGTQVSRDSSAEVHDLRLQAANAGCVSQQNKNRLVTYPAPGGLGAGYLRGTGDTAVVLLHQAGGGLCQWMTHADQYAAQGMRGFALDILSDTRVDDTVAAIAYLRANGAKRVFLVGASMGGTTALVAAVQTQPPVDGVISLSGPVAYSSANAGPAVKTLTMPVVFAAGENEGTFTADARTLYADCGSAAKKLILLPTSEHGVGLMSRGMDDFVVAFLADPVAALKLTV